MDLGRERERRLNWLRGYYPCLDHRRCRQPGRERFRPGVPRTATEGCETAIVIRVGSGGPIWTSDLWVMRPNDRWTGAVKIARVKE